MDEAARQVCLVYAEVGEVHAWQPLGNHGGFSGAQLWRLETAVGPLCLRAWPAAATRQRIEMVHRYQRLARDRHPFVPRLLITRTGQHCVEFGGRFWELSTWQPGKADFHANPTEERLRSAATALAVLHSTWGPGVEQQDVPRAIRRRLERLAEWERIHPERLLARLEQACGGFDSPTKRAWEQLRRWRLPAIAALTPWANKQLPVQPCLRDVWHDHVLFEEDRVTGIVDFAGVGRDTPATDLARLIGSLVGDDEAQRETARTAYEQRLPLHADERRLLDLLDRTGVVVGAANWLRWLFAEGRRFENDVAVAKRLAELAGRMEAWKSKTHGFGPASLVEA